MLTITVRFSIGLTDEELLAKIRAYLASTELYIGVDLSPLIVTSVIKQVIPDAFTSKKVSNTMAIFYCFKFECSVTDLFRGFDYFDWLH